MTMETTDTGHICAGQAICFRCFKAGVERTRRRREAWAQRSLPFETVEPRLTPRELLHRRQMLAHLEAAARRA